MRARFQGMTGCGDLFETSRLLAFASGRDALRSFFQKKIDHLVDEFTSADPMELRESRGIDSGNFVHAACYEMTGRSVRKKRPWQRNHGSDGALPSIAAATFLKTL